MLNVYLFNNVENFYETYSEIYIYYLTCIILLILALVKIITYF